MDIINQPHDKFFKAVFTDKEVAIDFLTNYLPAELLAITDLKTTTIEKDNYIDEELTEYYSDLLYKAKINQKDSYIYFLIEHKSYISYQTPYQILKYMIKIWEAKAEKAKRLPLIIPIVIYHGENKWQVDKKFIKMIEGIEELPPEIIKHIPAFEYILYDLTTYEIEELKGNIKLRETIKILQAISQDLEKFLKVIEETMITLEQQGWTEENHRYFITYIIYIMSARADITIEDINQVAKKISPERSEDMMTIAEKLIKEGMEKGIEIGIEKGMEKGIEKGLLEGKRKTAKNFLQQGISPELVAKASELPLEEILKLKKEIEN